MKNLKAAFLICAFLIAISSAGVFLLAPKMHKPLQFSVIDYLIKFNSDNSMTTTKKVTDYPSIKEGE